MEAEIQRAFDEILADSPEMTFFEACAELVKKGELNFEATQDPTVHVFLYNIFRHGKQRANQSRATTS